MLNRIKVAAAATLALLAATAFATPTYSFRIYTPGVRATAAQATQSPGYPFSSFTFSTCGASGPSGPTLSACRSSAAYAATAWASDSSQFNVSNGIQQWTVPATGTYLITAAGAAGGYPTSSTSCVPGKAPSAQGSGAVISTTALLTQGTILQILVGQPGTGNTNNAGGGGGSFVAAGSSPLVVAGGGGGASYCDGSNPQNGSSGQAGTAGYGTTGGTGGAGATSVYVSGWGSGGAGFIGNGANNTCGIAHAFLAGGAGGTGTGGFGGGGSGCGTNGAGGGGGGYSGGGAGGGGGGSYYSGTLVSSSLNAGAAYVTVQKQ
jgi:hypothetical protein